MHVDTAKLRSTKGAVMRVQEVMTVDVTAARPDMSLKDAAGRLATQRISGMPVVDEDGTVLGVISEADVVAKALGPSEQRPGPLARLLHREAIDERGLEAGVVREAMTAPAITIEGHRSVATAAQVMIEHDVNRLPVVRNGRLAGIVTRADLVRAFSRSDDDLAREVRDVATLQQELWHDHEPLEIAVAQGEVTLSGSVRFADEADVLPKMVRTVPGVVSVRSDLTVRERA
jgi:CBS domain-containing protein